MENVEFRCLNCGNTEERKLLHGKSTVLGTLPIINRDATCCSEPRYEDTYGYHRELMERSVRDYIPVLRA